MKVVVIGTGIAGVTLAVELVKLFVHDKTSLSLTIISGTPAVKVVENVVKISKTLEHFTVDEVSIESLFKRLETVKGTGVSIEILQGIVTRVDRELQTIELQDRKEPIGYDSLCVCTGARPAVLSTNPRVYTIRDVDSLEKIAAKIQKARKIAIVGNGGIALEFVHNCPVTCHIDWIVKDFHLGSHYLDETASAFLIPTAFPDSDPVIERKDSTETKEKPSLESKKLFDTKTLPETALGPKWIEHLSKLMQSTSETKSTLKMHFNAQIDRIEDNLSTESHPVRIFLQDESSIDCDIVLSAIGVVPNTEFLKGVVEINEEGAIVVNEFLQSSDSHIYAAGDCCFTKGFYDNFPLWIQMKLWTQAKMMGSYLAHVINGEVTDELQVWIQFEMFSHVTQFFGKKVVMFGLYNSQTLSEDEFETVMRVKPEESYVKLVISRGKLLGALLIGETDLEETCENLILNGTDISHLGSEILREDVDLEDYFD